MIAVMAGMENASGASDNTSIGLSNYYDFRESSGSLIDRYGNTDGDVLGIITREVTGISGSGYAFTSGGRVSFPAYNLPTGNSNNNNYTINLWINPSGSFDKNLFANEWGSRGINAYIRTGGELALYHYRAGFNFDVNDTNYTLSLGVFTMITVSYNNTDNKAQIYFNGVYNQTLVGGFDRPEEDHLFFLGHDPDANIADSFNGTMDEVAFYNRPLASNEVLTLYNQRNLSAITGIINATPTIDSVTFNPSSNDGTQNQRIEINATDATNDTLFNFTRWFKNGIFNQTWNDVVQVGQANFSAGDNLTIEVIVGDLNTNTTPANYTIGIADTGPPFINRLSSPLVATNGDNINFQINVTDGGNSLLSTGCILGFIQETLGIPHFNLTSSARSGDITSRIYSTQGIGTLQWHSVWCDDLALNRVTNTSVGINITISAASSSSASAGGGGGGSSSSSCELDLLRPQEGQKVTLASREGVKAISADMIIRNIGSGSSPVLWTIEDNKYLEENCEFEEEIQDIIPNIQAKNKVSCIVDEKTQLGRIKITGCGEGNYILSVSNNFWIGLANAVIKGENFTFFGISIYAGAWIVIFTIGTFIGVITVVGGSVYLYRAFIGKN